ncbi:unnamed protein product [Caenorhabditis angaria]|uniref:RNA exonuclease 4 n=1 Tax=Caenorhabditis angaria TaxID=860376 RepID=A0A9P1N0M6_9PELO|nr:unnamed protein product [Caenorhabditis angaria]
MAAKIIDAKDISPAWKVLQMKMKEEEAAKPEKMEEDADNEGFTKVLTKNQKKQLNRKRRAQEALEEAMNSQKKSREHYDIPVLIKDDEIGEATQLMALDCEYVGGGNEGNIDILARVSIVNDKGKIVYDKYVRPTEKVTDYRTQVSGIRPEDLSKTSQKCLTFDQVQKETTKLIEGKMIVGHAIHNDFRVLKIAHGRKMTRDTAKCLVLKQRVQQNRGTPSLKKLAKEVLGIDIQQGEHCSIQDARVALRLYEAVKKQWEAEIKRFRS